MHRRRLLIPAALIGSLGIALTPALAEAATPGASAASSATQQTVKSVKPLSATAGAAFKKFASPANKSVHLPKAALAAISTAHTAATTGSGTTIYATTGDINCSPDTGTGTAAEPYCNLQDAVDAAQSGDTIDVDGSVGYSWDQPVTITTSDLTVVGTSTQSWLGGALTLDGVSDVKISNMMIEGLNNTGADVTVEDSTGVTIDSSYIGGSPSAQKGISIDGLSSDIAITRTYVDSGQNKTAGGAITIASGAKNIQLAGDLIANSSVSATDVSGLEITGDTIQRGCSGAIDVEGASTGVTLENNVLEDANSSTTNGISDAQCVSGGDGWAPDVTVAAAAAGGVTADYNDFDVQSGDTTAPYEWAGSTYATTAAFTAATSEGSHDTNDTTEFVPVYLRDNESNNMAATPSEQSPADGSADTAAPGELTSDYYGHSPYNTRGAIQVTGPNPNLGVSVDGGDTSAFGVGLIATPTDYSASTDDLTITVDWGDGTHSTIVDNQGDAEPASHIYRALGTYTITVTVDDGQYDTATNTVSGVQTAGSEYTAYGPARILNTRTGLGASEAAVAPGGTVKLKVVGAGPAEDPIPSGITAVVLNVTVTDPSSIGVLTVYPDQDETGAPEGVASTSNVNFGFNETVPNLVMVPVGPNGVVDLYNNSKGHTQVIADVSGYFLPQPGSGYVSITPKRLLDTRQTKQTIPANGSLTLTVEGADKDAIPTSGVTAVAANLTATNGTTIGFITAYPTGGTVPDVSNVNYAAHQNIPNMAIVPVSAKGQVTFHNSGSGSVDLIVDAFGYYTSNGSSGVSSAYLPLPTPQRLLDTRDVQGEHLPIPGDYPFGLPFFDTPDVTGEVFNATVVDPQSIGFLSLFPYEPSDPGAVPSTSNVNFGFHETVPNLVIASPGTEYDSQEGGYDTGIYLNSTGSSDLILDLFGLFLND